MKVFGRLSAADENHVPWASWCLGGGFSFFNRDYIYLNILSVVKRFDGLSVAAVGVAERVMTDGALPAARMKLQILARKEVLGSAIVII